MHLLRLLLTGAATLRQGRVPVRVEAQRDRLLAVKRGEVAWEEVNAWRGELHRDFEAALAATRLPERPDYEAANRFLIKARREMAVQPPANDTQSQGVDGNGHAERPVPPALHPWLGGAEVGRTRAIAVDSG